MAKKSGQLTRVRLYHNTVGTIIVWAESGEARNLDRALNSIDEDNSVELVDIGKYNILIDGGVK